MTATTHTPLSLRAMEAFDAEEQSRRDEERHDLKQKSDGLIRDAGKAITDMLGVTFDSCVTAWIGDDKGIVDFEIDGVPFRYEELWDEIDYHRDFYVRLRCTREGCRHQDEPVLQIVRDLPDVGRALSLTNNPVHFKKYDGPLGQKAWCNGEPVDGPKPSNIQTRRIVQIAACAWAANLDKEDGGASETLFALCEDGTLWARETIRGGTKWVAINAPAIEVA